MIPAITFVFAKGMSFSAPFAAACTGGKTFFFFPDWYEFVKTTSTNAAGNCVPVPIFPSDIPVVGLALVEILLRLAGLAAIFGIIAAGVGYITAQGNPEKAASARRRLYNALIGLGIAFTAAAVVEFIGNSLT